MNVNPISSSPISGLGVESSREKPTDGATFASMLNKSLSETNDLMVTADQKGVELALGKTENLHDAMIAFEKAETAFKLLTQVRNKAIEAYHDIMKMQV